MENTEYRVLPNSKIVYAILAEQKRTQEMINVLI